MDQERVSSDTSAWVISIVETIDFDDNEIVTNFRYLTFKNVFRFCTIRCLSCPIHEVK